jgi:2-oxoglutarate-Fe(II)-dependent oxygenase superfamily protein
VRLYLDPEHLMRVAKENSAGYARANPFPHVVLDGVFPEEALDLALQHFPSPRSDVWKEYDNYHEVKLETQGEERLPPELSLLLYQFNSAPFLAFLERLTGIANLLPDPYFYGGGLHQIERGGKLGVHADFSAHGKLPLHRRLNVLVYLNRDWQEEWGGHLELWDAERTACRKRVLPVFNRMVVFTITDWAFHGHPEPLTCPPEVTRKSIALYYFTVDRPAGETMDGRVQTLFIERPGENVPAETVFGRDGYSGLARDRFVPKKQTSLTRSVLKKLTPPLLVDIARRARRPKV